MAQRILSTREGIMVSECKDGECVPCLRLLGVAESTIDSGGCAGL